MENEGAATPPVLATYLRGLKTLSAAAQYRNCPELEEPLGRATAHPGRPLSNIRDMVKLPPASAHAYSGVTLAEVRGTIYSVFSLAELLGLPPTPTPELSVAIVEAGSTKYGLAVDKFLSEVEVLVKPLTGGLEQCKEFQGAAIMGDGRVVLVLNAMECHGWDRTECT